MPVILSDETDTIYACDCCNKYIVYDEMYGGQQNYMCKIFNEHNASAQMPKFLRYGNYCEDCFKHIGKYVYQMIDVVLTITATNKLKGAINERIKNNRAIKNDVS